MVEIEVLLCERRFASSNKSGINLLKLGGAAKNLNSTGFSYNGSTGSKGLIDFLFSSEKDAARNVPAIDLTYNFLLSQEDIVVTASPSTTTLNQIPTTLSITDQISVYTGRSYDKKCDTDKDNDGTYAREDFGITITLTPTIHEPELDGDENLLFITLENDIKFETITSNEQERPKVHKRHIQNTVRIADGQTVIIGGLRSNSIEESSQKIPFLGEIPGFAKVFGSDQQTNKNSEMFIFIKPKILSDPTNDLIKIRDAKLRNRPGETEYFFQLLNESRANQKKWKFQESLELFLGSGKLNEQKL
jgi:general secretion pathway protein D